MQPQGWPGFSPGPLSVTMSPENPDFQFRGTSHEQPDSPLVFMRTPGPTHEHACPDSSQRFSSWMDKTSPYTARKTPPTVSMKSVAHGDENTPPGPDLRRDHTKKDSSFGSQQHFQAWLQATNSTSWTPRKSPATSTPPPAPAPSPAAVPMSAVQALQHSAATPPSAHQIRLEHPRATPATEQDADTSDDDDAGEALTTIGAAQVAAATDRAAAAARDDRGLQASSRSILQPRQQQLPMNTPPRVPAPSPMASSPAPSRQHAQQTMLLQAAADRMVQHSLATPMSNLSISRTAHARQNADTPSATPMSPGLLLERSVGRCGAQGPPASPAEKLIGLMMSPPGASRHRPQHQHSQQHHQQHLTPSRLSAAFDAPRAAAAPLSPTLQVIDLMLQANVDTDTDNSTDATPSTQQQPTTTDPKVGFGSAEPCPGRHGASDASSDASSVAGSDPESDDEMDLSELQALCGSALQGVAPDTPLSAILGMLTGTPEVVAALTPQQGSGDQHQGGHDGIGPRVLFGDE